MKGSIRRRGERSWELKFDIGTDAQGGRKIAYRSYKGTKAGAQAALTEYLAALGKQEYVPATKVTIGAFVGAQIEAWLARQAIGAKTAERYRELLKNQIAPHLGNTSLQSVNSLQIGAWHGDLLKAGLSPLTVRHAHRLLGKALKDAKSGGMTNRIATADIAPPAPQERDVAILQLAEVDMVLDRLQGNSLLPMVAIALYAGLRRGEVLALRWDAVDLEAGKLAVVASLEQLADGTLTFKAPKTKAGRRLIAMPDRLISILKAHRLEQLQLRLKLGQGRMPDDALLFADLEGKPLSPRAVSKRWEAFAQKTGIGAVTYHNLRHSHASLLRHAGVDLAVVSKRLGHTKISTTLNIYTHLFEHADDQAAEALNVSLRGGK